MRSRITAAGRRGMYVSIMLFRVLELREAYLRKVSDTVNDLDNVLYEVATKGSGCPQSHTHRTHPFSALVA